MEEWLERYGITLNDLTIWLTIAALVVAILTLWHQMRREEAKKRRKGRRGRGNPESQYADWFLRTYSTYVNPYLDKTERIALNRTYVTLLFQDSTGDAENRLVATETIAARSAGHAFVIGDPGSGKSTLLKAFGVRLLETARPAGGFSLRPRARRPTEVPIFVSLRKFAKRSDERTGLAAYIVTDVLGAGSGLAAGDAADLLRQLLDERRCVVLLDGLDEVASEAYGVVRDEIHRFAVDRTPDRPTGRARLVITCRRHNFLRVRDDWTTTLARRIFTLAPLRDSEMVNYLTRMRERFKAPDGPGRFMAAVRASGTLDLHRTPLVLAMSVGLFAPQENFDIPHSVSELYQIMIKEMLERHRFRHDPPGGPNRFEADDKHRLLREFALVAATGPIGFDEFERRDLVALAEPMAPLLRRVRPDEVGDFVDEVLDRSGLLTDTTDGDAKAFVFAHRSIQEHLVADELRRLDDDGARLLLGYAANAEWRQVIVFYTAARDQRYVSPFLRDLAERNVVLAGACLAGADCTDEVAVPILDALESRLRRREELMPTLGALVAAANSPRPTVSDVAVRRVQTALVNVVHETEVVGSLGGDVEGVLRVLDVLANGGGGQVAALVPRLARAMPDDSRLVEPLWRCLSAPGIDVHPDAEAAIVQRLLMLAMDEDCFVELQRQEPLIRDFIDDDLRARAYPFRRGHDLSSPIVTLLALADHLGVTPPEPNRFFQAKADRPRFARLEVDKARTRSISLFAVARLVSSIGAVVALGAAAVTLIRDWHVLYQPYRWWSIPIFVGPQLAALVTFGVLTDWASRRKVGSWVRKNWAVESKDETGNIMAVVSPEGVATVIGLFLLPAAYALSLAALVEESLVAYLVLATCAPLSLHWILLVDAFDRDRRHHVYRPNVFVDAYDDPRSRHWLVATHDDKSSSRPQPAGLT
jgi:hypothetical protein